VEAKVKRMLSKVLWNDEFRERFVERGAERRYRGKLEAR
jgi:hypothetical protein